MSFYRMSLDNRNSYLFSRDVHLHQLQHIFVALMLYSILVKLINILSCEIWHLILYFFLFLFLSRRVDLYFSTDRFFNEVKHRRGRANVLHIHTHVWITHWKLQTFFSKKAVNFLETRIFVFFHHESISPSLYKTHQLFFGSLSAQTFWKLHHFQFELADFTASKPKLVYEKISKFICSQTLVKQSCPVLATSIKKLNQLLLADTVFYFGHQFKQRLC